MKVIYYIITASAVFIVLGILIFCYANRRRSNTIINTSKQCMTTINKDEIFKMLVCGNDTIIDKYKEYIYLLLYVICKLNSSDFYIHTSRLDDNFNFNKDNTFNYIKEEIFDKKNIKILLDFGNNKEISDRFKDIITKGIYEYALAQ